MKKFVFLLSMIVYSMACNATSCISNEEAINERSNAYRKEVKINVEKMGTEIDVSVNLPLKIEGLAFSSITLIKGANGGEASFIMPLDTRLEDGRILAWYMINTKLADENIIEANYGDPCSVSIRYQLEYGNGQIHPKNK